MSNAVAVKDFVAECLRESRRLERKQKLEEALAAVERATAHMNHPELGWKVAVRFADLCNKLSHDCNSHYLRRADAVLNDLISTYKKEKGPVNVELIEVYVKTLRKWVEFHRAQRSHHLALRYTNKAIKLITETPIISSRLSKLLLQCRTDLLWICLALKSYSDVIAAAHKTLSWLAQDPGLGRGLSAEAQLTALYCTAVSHSALGDYEAVVATCRDALQQVTGLLSPTHRLVLLTQDLLSSCEGELTSRSTSAVVQESKTLRKFQSIGVIERKARRLQFDSSTQCLPPQQILHRTISNALSTDTQLLKLDQKKSAVEYYKADEETRKQLAELRLRRHCRKFQGKDGGADYVRQRLTFNQPSNVGRLKQTAQVKSRRQSVVLANRRERRLVKSQSEVRPEIFTAAKETIEGVLEELHADLRLGGKGFKQLAPQIKSCALAESAWVCSPEIYDQTFKSSLRSLFTNPDS